MKSLLILSIVTVLFFSVFANSDAFAQYYSTSLTLDSIPSNVKSGSIITFSGKLASGEQGLKGGTIYIKDDVDFGRDDVLGTVTTDENGKYHATWTASPRSDGGAYDFYAVFEGASNFDDSRSRTYSVTVTSSGTSDSASSSYSSTYIPTKITLDRMITSANTGQIVTFSGKLTANGQGLSGATVLIKDEDLADLNDSLVSTTTNSAGKFSVDWKVKNTDSGDRKFSALILDLYGGFGGASQLNQIYNLAEANTVEIYAEFKGTSQYSKSNTCLIENVDGVLQENCNNNILSIKDDSSFENLIMSTVLSEMGISAAGSDTLESILTNQADSRDAADFEGYLLDALQDELDLGNTDLSMQEMLNLLDDPSLAAMYKTTSVTPPKSSTIPSYSPPKSSNPSYSTTTDYDEDGIPDYRDECKYIKENYNGYEDTDGCLDIKPLKSFSTDADMLKEFYKPQYDPAEAVKAKQEKEARELRQKQLKQEAIVLQKQSYDKLEILKRDVSVAEESLKQVTSESSEQKKELDHAWNLLKNSQKTISEIEDRYKNGDNHIGFQLFDNAKMYYTFQPNDSKMIGDNLNEISKSIDVIKEMQEKTCFLIWCW